MYLTNEASFFFFSSHSQIRNTVHPRASNIAVTLGHASYFAPASFASIPDDLRAGCFGNRAHARNSRLQIPLFSASEIQNQDDP